MRVWMVLPFGPPFWWWKWPRHSPTLFHTINCSSWELAYHVHFCILQHFSGQEGNTGTILMLMLRFIPEAESPSTQTTQSPFFFHVAETKKKLRTFPVLPKLSFGKALWLAPNNSSNHVIVKQPRKSLLKTSLWRAYRCSIILRFNLLLYRNIRFRCHWGLNSNVAHWVRENHCGS